MSSMALMELHLWFRKRRKEPKLEALEKIKGELMVLGFISLLLTFGQIYIANVCIPTKLADTMLPCPIKHHGGHHLEPEHETAPKEEPDHHRRLLWNDHRILAGGEPAKGCKKEKAELAMLSFHKNGELKWTRIQANCTKGIPGYVPLISIHGLHQLHIFIFFLAVFHVIYSAITMTLGRLKIRGWKEWEQFETETNDEFNDWIRVAFLTRNNDVICLNVHFCLIRIHILFGVALVIVGFLVELNKI
ncbi:MLO-like protein 8 isoform X5 [Camellia sinensis]|uniref:MLO-like protein 8 isoform X5 n=1 Tax=Camellia sinensis TaxID=4442 RepID=UPI0010355F2E|nr:MLO-like protein 8 isoform X5 [Camellia sinensis]XP_028075664.1 MLO-like protein 8 isoform X5 [Camellia sinensis]